MEVPAREDKVTIGVHHRLLKWGEEDQTSPKASQSGLCRVGSRARLHLKRGVKRGTTKVEAHRGEACGSPR